MDSLDNTVWSTYNHGPGPGIWLDLDTEGTHTAPDANDPTGWSYTGGDIRMHTLYKEAVPNYTFKGTRRVCWTYYDQVLEPLVIDEECSSDILMELQCQPFKFDNYPTPPSNQF